MKRSDLDNVIASVLSGPRKKRDEAAAALYQLREGDPKGKELGLAYEELRLTQASVVLDVLENMAAAIRKV